MNHAGMHTVGDATAEALAEESMSHSADWDLKQFAPMVAQHPLLVVSSEDGGAASNERIANAVDGQPNSKVTRVHLMTDHSYNDQRIALTTALLSWLSSIVGNDTHGRSSP